MTYELVFWVLTLIIGVSIGIFVALANMHSKVSGYIILDCSEPDDKALLYLELTDDAETLLNKKVVTFKTKIKK